MTQQTKRQYILMVNPIDFATRHMIETQLGKIMDRGVTTAIHAFVNWDSVDNDDTYPIINYIRIRTVFDIIRVLVYLFR